MRALRGGAHLPIVNALRVPETDIISWAWDFFLGRGIFFGSGEFFWGWGIVWGAENFFGAGDVFEVV